MTTVENPPDNADLTASEITWNLDDLLDGQTPDGLLAAAKTKVDAIQHYRGTLGDLGPDEFADLISVVADVSVLLSRAGHYGSLRFAENTGDAQRAALMQQIDEESTALAAQLVFVELEFAALDDSKADELLAGERIGFARHHLTRTRKNRPHLLTEDQETVLIESSVSRGPAWVRLFSELVAAIEVELPDDDGATQTAGLEQGLSGLQHPDRSVRQRSAEAVSAGLATTLKTRAFVFNTLLLEKSVDDRLRQHSTWISSRNLDNEASDESVDALVSAVVSRYDLPQRWYRLKAQVLGLDRLADYDRMASVAESSQQVGWSEATEIVRSSYRAFSPELADIVDRFIDEGWIDAPTRPGKQLGAFCAYGVPDSHPYVMLNWTSRTRDVATLAHELGHGVHGYLAREQGIFHQSTPLTVAETASVFGETLTNNQLLNRLDDPRERFALLASVVDDSIATVFRQVAMNRFEHACHTARRTQGELSVETFGDLWIASQTDMMGDSVELTENYRTWWSYIPHFIGAPGYVYAYAYGQLLALSVYARYQDEGPSFVPSYLEMLSAGGSCSPEALGSIVNCDLTDPGFWDAGLDIVESQLVAAEQAAQAL